MAAPGGGGAAARRSRSEDLRRARTGGRRTEAPSARVGDVSCAPRTAGSAPPGVIIRPETEAEHDSIRQVNDEAFGDTLEGKIVDAIRASNRFVPELSL